LRSCLFLTENGTEDTLSSSHYSECSENSYIHRKIYESHKDFVEFPAYGSSAMVVNKHHYLAIGGHSREFYGHGAEDYDVLHRLSSYYSKGPKTADYYNNTKSNSIDNYHGFRAYFALYGIDVFNRGSSFSICGIP
jgi:predicted glycosyltransferase involved in capsule biosynthesis